MLQVVSRACYAIVACAVCSPTFGQLIVGHRGASHDAPENTLASIRLAFEQGADAAEADFKLSSDGRVVCIHDDDTERVAGQKLIVKKTPFDQLRALDVGSWKGTQWHGERMPTMEEVLALIPPGKKFFIELKFGPRIVAPLARILKSSNLSTDQIVIISFNAKTIAKVEQRLPHLRTHWLARYEELKGCRLAPTVDEVIATLQQIGADGFGSEARPEHFDEHFIKKLRASGCDEFHVWTVDDPEVARFYQRLGAWSVTSNRPGWLRGQLEAAPAK